MLTRFNGVVFFPSYQHQLFYLFYPKYVFLSFTSPYLTFLHSLDLGKFSERSIAGMVQEVEILNIL
jgi:hypothetical protein